MDRYPSLHFQCGPWTSPMISRPTSRCQYFFGHHSGHLGFCPTTLSSIVLNEWVSLLFFLLVCFYIFTQSSLLRLISSKMLMTQKQFSLSLALYLFLLHTHAHKHTHVFFMEKIQIKEDPREIFLCRGWEKTFEDTKKPDFIELLACQSNPPHSPGINQLPSCSMPSQKELPLEKSDSEISRTDSSL